MKTTLSWLLAAVAVLPVMAASSVDCTYLRNPDRFHFSPDQHWREISRTFSRPRINSPADSGPMPRKNFIDELIFGRMESDGIRPAPLADDPEFVRRVYLDLIGRIPSVDQFRSFIDDTNPAKRDALIDSLIGTEPFVDKWTMFFGDLFRNDGPSSNVNRYTQGRDAFYKYLRESVAMNKPYSRIAQELIAGTGDTFLSGPTNWVVGGTVPMGPIQDTYDGQAVNVAQMFLGINVVDCLLCHDGARHLDAVNLWGAQQKRSTLWGLSAYFAQTDMKREIVSQDPVAARFVVSDLPKGDYVLNTKTGNRVAREALPGGTVVLPQYPFGIDSSDSIDAPRRGNRRQALAGAITSDPQFARAAVNYIWEKLMVEALVSPSNGFDLARLDPNDPPPAPWTLQPNNPELLDALAQWFRANNTDLRQLIALIAKSNAYQLSSSYPGTWLSSYVPYYARRYARRLDAEEIHDAIVQATGVMPHYQLDYAGAIYPLPPATWAMQLPDTREPRTNGQAAQFLNAFGRGDRDVNMRTSNGSIVQALNMMNNNFVMSRIHANNDGSNVQRLLGMTSDPAQIIEELYLATLSREPSAAEMLGASNIMRQAGVGRGAELIQWSLLNKLEFLFSY